MIAAGISSEVLNKLENQLVIHGRVSHDEVLRILMGTHFTLLIRSPEQRYAKAGFPTKVVESLARSTPVICNLTSDLYLYLIDNENALLVNNGDCYTLSGVLEKAICMSEQERARMCREAAVAAFEKFYQNNYLKQLELLLSEISLVSR